MHFSVIIVEIIFISIFSEDNHMIMDCAEGTYNQIVRHFGVDEADRILAFTKAIYISHLHPDHHMGAIYLLKKRIQAVNKLNSPHKKVYLLAPAQIAYWLYNYHLHFEPILNSLEFITNQDLQVSWLLLLFFFQIHNYEHFY